MLFNNKNNNEYFINKTLSKSKFNSLIKIFRFFRYFVDDLNNFFVNFSQLQRIKFIKIFNFFLFINSSTLLTNFRRHINIILIEKVIYKKLIELLSLIIDIIDFIFKQQQIIVVIVRQMLNV